MRRYLQRYFYFILGLAINSFGIAFITKSSLGTSQISSIPYVFSLFFQNISFGTFTFLFNMLYILLQILLLKKDFHPVQFLQVVANLLFSVLIDISMSALSWFNPDTLVLRGVSLIAGCIILALGISIEVAPNVIVVPGEGIVRAIAQVTGREFGKIKVCFDVILILIALIFSLLFFHNIQGLGIGTIVSAVAVGKLVSLINKKFPFIGSIKALDAAACGI